MDEYLYIQWAKLQADRRRLERERQEQLRAQQPAERAETRKHAGAPAASRVLTGAFRWRAQS